MQRTTLLLTAAMCTVAAATPALQQAPERPPFRAGVEAVVLDVAVVDGDGRPVADLGPDDFTVTVAGQPRRVVSATFVAPAAPARDGVADAPASRLPISTNDGIGLGRLLVFVVDQSTLEQGEVRQLADSAAGLFDRLTMADRTALVVMPVGTGVPFTADHDRVFQGLRRTPGLASPLSSETHNLGLEEVRSIAAGDFIALHSVASRECASEVQLAGRGGGAGAGGGQGGQGGGAGGGGDVSRPAAGGGLESNSAFESDDSCTRRIQFDATTLWHQLHSTALASMTALRSVLAELKKVPGDKTLVLISGGWPLEVREATSELTPIADLAAQARVTIVTLFAWSNEASADRRMISTAPLADQTVRRWPLQTLAGMTGGASYRVDVGAASIFDRLGRELSGYYRIGVEQDLKDRDGRARPLKVQVSRSGVTTRAPERFVALHYADRDVPARLESALTSPLPATGLGLRLTSYLAADPDVPSRIKVLLVGDAYGLQPGDVTFQLALQDASGKGVASRAQVIGSASSDRLPFSTSISVEPGRYTIRAAVMDAASAVGSVDHVIDARRTTIGEISTSDLMLGRAPAEAGQDAGFVLDRLRQDDRLVLQLDLEGQAEQVRSADVLFEIAASDESPALVTVEATRASGGFSGTAQGVADLRLLPPGSYVARARIAAAAARGVVHRPFIVTQAPGPGRAAGDDAATGAGLIATKPGTAHVRLKAPPFTVEQVLAPDVLGVFLDRLAARPEAAVASVRPLLDQLRTGEPSLLAVPDGLADEAPVAASFVTGLSRLARSELDPAAQSFRAALRSSSDFYPAMVYLGACFAAGGKDNEAAGAWQTALIKEGDVPAVHALLIDALLRLNRTEAALAAAERARRRWPDDPAFGRRFVASAIGAGRYSDALAALDALPAAGPDDEPVVVLALQVVYEAIVKGPPIEGADADKARLLRYADTYHRLNGPSTALVDAWVADATRAR